MQQARFNMIHQQIKPYDVSCHRILELMSETPRQDFVPKTFESMAYADISVPLGEGHMMLQPKIVARALQALNIQPDETVLEIGTGTGYVTYLLSQIAKHVYSVDINQHMFELAQSNLQNKATNITLKHLDGIGGWEQHAPYSTMFIAGSFPVELPAALVAQMAIHGRCFAIIGKGPAMKACLFTKTSAGLSTEVMFETEAPALLNALAPPNFIF